MKVLHLPTPVGGNAWGLSQAERRLGLESATLYAEQTWADYPGIIILNSANPKRLRLLESSIWAALTIPQKYDVLHFNFGTSLIDFTNHGVIFGICRCTASRNYLLPTTAVMPE